MTSSTTTTITTTTVESNDPSRPTYVVFLLDRSGSMDDIKAATMEAFNAYLDGLSSTPDLLFSLLQFDTGGLDKVCVMTPPGLAPRLNHANYTPRGGTPLIDAAMKTIRAMEGFLAGRGAELGSKPGILAPAPKVVVCIQTDGQENSSREHTWEELKSLVKAKTALGWQFNFMGAGIDAYDQGQRMGISIGSTMSYDSKNLGATRAAYYATASNTAGFAMGVSQSTAFSDSQKAAAGDAFAQAWGGTAGTLGGVAGGLPDVDLSTPPAATPTPSQPNPPRWHSKRHQVLPDIAL